MHLGTKKTCKARWDFKIMVSLFKNFLFYSRAHCVMRQTAFLWNKVLLGLYFTLQLLATQLSFGGSRNFCKWKKNRYTHTHTPTDILLHVWNMSTAFSKRQTTAISLLWTGLLWIERGLSCPQPLVFYMWGVTCVECLLPNFFLSY